MLYKIFIAFIKWLYISPILFILDNIIVILYNYNIISYKFKKNIQYLYHILGYIHIYNHFNFIKYLLKI